MKTAVQMDPIEGINIEGDSTFVLLLEAQRRGYPVWHYTPDDLLYRDGSVFAHARPLTVQREKGQHYNFGAPTILDLSTMDVVLMRQDPPFDMAYITATHLLDMIENTTLVVNNPSHVRNAPEKLFTLFYHDLMPPTMIARKLQDIQVFQKEHGDIVVKPLFGKGGEGVFHIQPGDPNLSSLMELFTSMSREPIIAQKFLPEVRQGDKRIILVDGEPVGAINRVPAKGQIRSNMIVGGTPEKSDLTPGEKEICARLGPELKKRNLLFVGIDVIGDWLTEINVTSPTGLQAINAFNNVQLEATIWDAVEEKISSRSKD